MNKPQTVNPNLPGWFDPAQILGEYLEGKRTAEIAQARGVTRETLTHWLLKAAAEDWKAAQLQRAIRRKEEAEELLDSAHDALELGRADRKLRSAQWDLERICRRIYGQDQLAQNTQAVQVVLNISRQPKPVAGALESPTGAQAPDTSDAL